jgi:lipoate---protein ligase
LPVFPSQFDVESFRHESRRLAVVREVDRPTLVLGSTQSTELIDSVAMRERRVELARRRGGGGAVYLGGGPGEQLWLDVWIPRDDPLWVADVSRAAQWIGAWWTEALAETGRRGLAVHRGRSVPGDHGDLVCFAGRGPGEVFDGGRKVVGLSQWRSRQGALFSSCAYVRWDPTTLVALMDVGGEEARAQLVRDLAPVAAGLAQLDPPVADLDGVRALLLDSLPAFGVTGQPGA